MPGNPMSPLLWNITGSGPDKQSCAIWSAFTGQTEEAMLDWGWLNACHPEDRDALRTLWKTAIQAQHTFTISCRVRDITEAYRSFRLWLIPFFHANHQLENWLIVPLEDIEISPICDEHWESQLIDQMIFNQAVIGVLCISLDGFILRTNNYFSQFTGYTEKELRSMTLWQLSSPEDVAPHLQAIHGSLLHHQNQPAFRARYIRKDGSSILVRLSPLLVCQPTNEPDSFFFLVENATDRVQDETERTKRLTQAREAHTEALARTHQLETIIESITEGILVCDNKGKVIESNSAVNTILHMDRAIGFARLSMWERIQRLKAFDGDGNVVPLERWPLSYLLRGENLPENVVEMRMILPDGAEIYVNHSGNSIRDQDNHIIGAVLVMHDVTERRRLERNVRKSFSILLTLAEELVHLPEASNKIAAPQQSATEQETSRLPLQALSEHLVNLTCQMLEYNYASITLIDPETDIMSPLAAAGTKLDVKQIYQEVVTNSHLSDYLDASDIAALRANKVVLCDVAIPRYSPEAYQLLIAPMIIDDRLLGMFSVEKSADRPNYTNEEISLTKAIAKLILLVIERQRLQQEWLESHLSELALLEANRRFDEFLSIASHELRTPLAGMKGNIQLALRRLALLKSPELTEMEGLAGKLEKIREYLLVAEHRVNVQNRMISDLLDVSRIQANKLELVMGPCDLALVVREAVEDQRYTVPERLITLAQPESEKIMLIADADRLGQVIHNYLTNALKYSPVQRPIRVVLDEQQNMARVSVHDEGPGLTPEDQKRIWERFYRVKNVHTQDSSAPGLGLGLYICHTIIEAHHGQIGLESTPGQGSTFWFALPLTPGTLADAGPVSNIFHREATSI
jgi:PAS domain S-box-containing protein